MIGFCRRVAVSTKTWRTSTTTVSGRDRSLAPEPGRRDVEVGEVVGVEAPALGVARRVRTGRRWTKAEDTETSVPAAALPPARVGRRRQVGAARGRAAGTRASGAPHTLCEPMFACLRSSRLRHLFPELLATALELVTLGEVRLAVASGPPRSGGFRGVRRRLPAPRGGERSGRGASACGLFVVLTPSVRRRRDAFLVADARSLVASARPVAHPAVLFRYRHDESRRVTPVFEPPRARSEAPRAAGGGSALSSAQLISSSSQPSPRRRRTTRRSPSRDAAIRWARSSLTPGRSSTRTSERSS